MAFIKTLIFSIFAVAAMAAPSQEGGAAPSGQTCGNGQTVACCDTSAGTALIAGLNCLIPILGQGCGNNIAACCPTSADGILNIQANCLSLPL